MYIQIKYVMVKMSEQSVLASIKAISAVYPIPNRFILCILGISAAEAGVRIIPGNVFSKRRDAYECCQNLEDLYLQKNE